MGIQKLREELEDAKNKNKLSADDTKQYEQLYNDWKAAKGDAVTKAAKVRDLRELWKRVSKNG